MQKLIRTSLLAIAVALAPAAAYATTMTSNDGYGHQSVFAHADQSFAADGDLRSKTGNRVYYRAVLVYNNYTDYICDHASPEVTSYTYVQVNTACSEFIPIPPSADGAAWKICRARTGLPDGCGGQSNYYW